MPNVTTEILIILLLLLANTVAGLVMTLLARVPKAGDRIECGPLSLEVADMDGFRVDKVIVTRRAGA